SACKTDALNLALEGDAFLWHAHSAKRAAQGACVFGCRVAGQSHPELRKHSAHPLCLELVILLHAIKRCCLLLLDAIKRRAQALNGRAHAAGCKRIAAQIGIARDAQSTFVVWWLRSANLACATAALPDRAGNLAGGTPIQPVERICARFHSGLPPQDLLELLLVLLLVEELSAGHPIDLPAQLRNPVLVAILHLGLA